ncbi:glycosyltransferase, partial [Paenibacillus odorifer]
VIVTHPDHYDILPYEILEGKTFIYDCMDNYKTFPGCKKEVMIKKEMKLINLCDGIIVSSMDLYNELIKYDENIEKKLHLINNGVDPEKFSLDNLSKENEVDIWRDNERKKVGFIGTISEWVDLNLIKLIALKNKNVDFYMIGPVDRSINLDDYNNIDNIFFTNVQPYYSIPNILDGLDVTIMPFKKSKLVESVNPVKIYEYLAMAKPVIAIRYDETKKFGDLIYTYETIEEFDSILKGLLTECIDDEVINNRIRFAKQNSWKERTSQLEGIIIECKSKAE